MNTHSRAYIEFTTFLSNLHMQVSSRHPVMLLAHVAQFYPNRYLRRAIKLAYRIWRRRNRPQPSKDPAKIVAAQKALIINETLYMPSEIRKALYIQTRHLQNKPLPLP